MRNFFIGLISGIGLTLLLAVGALFLVGLYFSGPSLAASVDAPEEVVQGEAFELRIAIENPHDEDVEFDNLDIPDAFFEVFELISLVPGAGSDPVGVFGSQTWFYDRPLASKDRLDLSLQLRGLVAGDHIQEFSVCNDYEDCTPLLLSIRVVANP